MSAPDRRAGGRELAAVAGLCTIRVPRRWLVGYVGTLLIVLVGALALSHTFTDVGHLTAWSIGLALAVVVAAARRQARVETGTGGTPSTAASPEMSG